MVSVALLVVLQSLLAASADGRLNAMQLLKKDFQLLSCLIFRRDCETVDLTDASGAYDRVLSKPSVSEFDVSSPGNVVRLDVYMEAQCPDTSRFVRAQLMPAWKKLSSTGRVDWNLIPFGKARCVEKTDGDFDCTCQHGPNECVLNQLMNCVIESIQHPDRYMETIECIQGKPNLDAALEKCIATSDSLSVNQMQQCASSAHGRKLLALAGAKTASLSPRLTFVPWIVLNGERVVDALYDLPGNLCKQLEPAPVACS